MRRILTTLFILAALVASLAAVVDGVTADDKDKGGPTPTKTPDAKATDTPDLKPTETIELKATETPDLKPTETEEHKATETPEPTKQPSPGDTDGDLCPDESESGPDEHLGGRRSHVNSWDYFNPTNDGENRVDDVLVVVNHYFIDEGQPGYDQKYDRTYVGPNPWNLGPPNGQQRVDDILDQVKQYFHDCGKDVKK